MGTRETSNKTSSFYDVVVECNKIVQLQYIDESVKMRKNMLICVVMHNKIRWDGKSDTLSFYNKFNAVTYRGTKQPMRIATQFGISTFLYVHIVNCLSVDKIMWWTKLFY